MRGDPGERRRYLDELATVRRPRIAGVRADYDKVLKQRTALLKSAAGARFRGDRGALDTLDVWDGHLAAHGAQLMAARLELVNELAPEVEKAYQLLAPASRPAAIGYRSAIELDDQGSTQDAEFPEAALLAALARRRDAELERGMCLVGPHRDDLELRLGDQPAKGFASHGESWSMALALRLASYELLRAEGSEPVLLLDDVFAELDTARRRALAGVAATAEQVLVTAAVGEDIPPDWDARRIGITPAGRRVRTDLGGQPVTDSENDPESPAGPPEHLSGLPGMDLVRRALEEARRGAQPGQGGRPRRRSPPPGAVRVAAAKLVGSGPGPA